MGFSESEESGRAFLPTELNLSRGGALVSLSSSTPTTNTACSSSATTTTTSTQYWDPDLAFKLIPVHDIDDLLVSLRGPC
ncbi:hypothetical protein PM082_019580 [Marasmius tenuissimus]|nr:hypothetical protein PM082_019580 [Marasmius tenuissimus]